MRIIFSLCVLLFMNVAWAGKAYLLTSLEISHRKITTLEKLFLEKLDHGPYELVIHHKVGPTLLHQVMTSNDTELVIWVSHAAGERGIKTGVSGKDVILDVWGNDVKKFFTLIPSNLKYLAIVGCQTQSIIDGFKNNGYYADYEELIIESFSKKVEMISGFKKVLKTVELIRPSLKTYPRSSSKVEITISSKSNTVNSGWLEYGDTILAYFPKGTIKIKRSISKTLLNRVSNKNIKYIRNLEYPEIELGQLKIASPFGSWKLFTDRTGRPIGGENQHLYLYR